MTIYVRVQTPYGFEWRTVEAENLLDAFDKARAPDVIRVLETSIVPGGVVT